MSSSKDSTATKEPRSEGAEALAEDEHRDFFTVGDEGRYQGGPEHVEHEAREMAELVNALDRSSPRTLRTPDQVAKRVRFSLIVGMVIGFCAAMVVFAILLALRDKPPTAPHDARALPPAAPLHAAFPSEPRPALPAPTPAPTWSESPPVEQSAPLVEANEKAAPIQASKRGPTKPASARPPALSSSLAHHPAPAPPPAQQAPTLPQVKPGEQAATASFPAQ